MMSDFREVGVKNDQKKPDIINWRSLTLNSFWLGAKKWEADHEDKEKAIRLLDLDLSKIEEDVFIVNKDDPISKFKLKFFKVFQKYIFRFKDQNINHNCILLTK